MVTLADSPEGTAFVQSTLGTLRLELISKLTEGFLNRQWVILNILQL